MCVVERTRVPGRDPGSVSSHSRFTQLDSAGCRSAICGPGAVGCGCRTAVRRSRAAVNRAGQSRTVWRGSQASAPSTRALRTDSGPTSATNSRGAVRRTPRKERPARLAGSLAWDPPKMTTSLGSSCCKKRACSKLLATMPSQPPCGLCSSTRRKASSAATHNTRRPLVRAFMVPAPLRDRRASHPSTKRRGSLYPAAV